MTSDAAAGRGRLLHATEAVAVNRRGSLMPPLIPTTETTDMQRPAATTTRTTHPPRTTTTLTSHRGRPRMTLRTVGTLEAGTPETMLDGSAATRNQTAFHTSRKSTLQRPRPPPTPGTAGTGTRMTLRTGRRQRQQNSPLRALTAVTVRITWEPPSRPGGIVPAAVARRQPF